MSAAQRNGDCVEVSFSDAGRGIGTVDLPPLSDRF